MSTERVRVGLVASDELRVEGIRAILRDGIDYDVQLLGVPRSSDLPGLEVVLLDASGMERLFEWIAAFCRLGPGVRLIVMDNENDMEHTQRVIGAGARGYLSHAAGGAELLGAIEAVRDGSLWAPRKVLARLLELAKREAAGAPREAVRLTRREVEVLRLLVLGRSNREIAEALGIDEGSVKAHLGRLMRKANVVNRTALTVRVLEDQWTGPKWE